MATLEQIDALVEAMWQLLDDMGPDGQCVCLQAKAMARVAFEPFRDLDAPSPMPLDEARRVLSVIERYS